MGSIQLWFAALILIFLPLRSWVLNSKVVVIESSKNEEEAMKIVDKPLTSKPDPNFYAARHPSEDLLCPIKLVPEKMLVVQI